MFGKFRWRMRTLMLLVAISAVGVWTYIHYSDPVREAFHQWKVNRPIWKRLDQTVTLRYPDGIPLPQLLSQLKPLGLVVLVDPQSLQDANLSLATPVKIDARSSTVKDALETALKPLGLRLFVHDGAVSITAIHEVE